MRYRVKYEDIGSRDYKQTWDYQAEIFKELIEGKKTGQSNITTATGSLHGT